MSRRDRHDPLERKRQRNDEQEQEEQAEQQVETEKRQEQTRDAAQDQIGNQGVAALLGVASVKPGEAGFSIDAMLNREEESEGPLLGGEEPPPDGPLTLDDLVRSWNPTTRRGQDTLEQSLGLYQPLPDEDEALLQAITGEKGPGELPAGTPGIDPLVQPPAESLLEDLGPLVRQAARFAPPSPLHRAWARVASPAAPLLTDPFGRLLHVRARTAALATLLSADGLETRGVSGRASPMILFLLDLAGRGRCIDEALEYVRDAQLRLPLARDVLLALLTSEEEGPAEETLPKEPLSLRPLEPGLASHVSATLSDLLALPPPSALVPALAQAPLDEDPEEDPLGLDQLMQGALKGALDPLAGIYDAQLQAAEKLAGACARLRTHTAGMLLAIARASSSWSSGVPALALLDLAQQVDHQIGETLQLLVEIGRAIQRRSVPPPGIRNGLRRVARALEQLGAQIPGWATPIVGAVVPKSPDLPLLEPAPFDVLEQAWAEGEPLAALPWLLSQGGDLESLAAALLVRAQAGERVSVAPALRSLAEQAHEQQRPALAAALSLCAGAALMHGAQDSPETLDRALEQALEQMPQALSRRNGLWLASAALVAMDAHALRGDFEQADLLRRQAGRSCWLLGARAGLSALLRWRPPMEEDEEPIGWYGYPEEAC